MNQWCSIAVAAALAAPVLGAELSSETSSNASAAVALPFEQEAWSTPANAIDTAVFAGLAARGILPANPCSDAVFIRRVYLDVIGTLPDPRDVRAFLNDRRPDKRAALIETLLVHEQFADYWSMKWGDLLRVKAEFPINLWPNAVQAYHRWIREAIKENRPYDRFARELLTASGSNFRDPPVNFYRAIQGRTPAAIGEAVALTFMGTRIKNWPPARRAGMAAFFSRVTYKKTAEWKEEIVGLDPAPTGAFTAIFPDGAAVRLTSDTDPRVVFADWLITPSNAWFSRSIANRVWSWFMGRGVIHEPDDIRPDNPPVQPVLLACLEHELIAARFDLRQLYRLILNSRTYQQSSIPRSTNAEAQTVFACYPVRRLDAEVLIDALCWIGGDGEKYSSAIPEPFTFIPENQRTIALADGSITSPFLEMFGRPPRDTGLESERNNQPTDAQRLYLLNSSDVQRRIARSRLLRRVMELAGRDRRAVSTWLYLTILSREPTAAEVAAAENYVRSSGGSQKDAMDDLAWALINSKEFLYRH